MERLNCLRCAYRHEDNGNCTAIGGFCTAVPAAHCRLLQKYLDTGLTPEKVLPKDKADEIALKCMRLADLESLCSYTRLRELAEADKDGRLAVLPCKIGGTVYLLLQDDVKHNPETCGWYISEDRVGAIAEGGFYLGDPADDIYVRNEEIGKEVFLTREGAERALEGRK